ncbi:MAG: exodeoxyribonuclease III [Alphaproteobacteria bacterium]|nr:exodeoxyribonuclease III [Alphaproteobacteria bacterium]
MVSENSPGLRVMSWNVNSVRRRLSQVGRLARVLRPDVLCLQETKVADDFFPRDAFLRLGYEHQIVLGQGGYNGVAILSRRRLEACPVRRWRGKEDKRHLSATVEIAPGGREVELHCFYVPSGGGVASRERNPKYDDKLRFLSAMTRWSRTLDAETPRLLVGDLNVAWLETDVWNHETARRSVGHTDLERESFGRMLRAGGWTDLERERVPAAEFHFSWWTYRHPGAFGAGRGWRLDYALGSPGLAPYVVGTDTVSRVRGWKGPSDHAPIVVDLDEGD